MPPPNKKAVLRHILESPVAAVGDLPDDRADSLAAEWRLIWKNLVS